MLGDFSAEIWLAEVAQYFNNACYEIKIFAKKHFLKKIIELTFFSNFKINELFPATVSWSNT